MSLLLDALKKAADEKKKKQELEGFGDTAESLQTDDLDLDLDIDEADYPVVDDEMLLATDVRDQAAEIPDDEAETEEEVVPVVEAFVADETQEIIDECDASIEHEVFAELEDDKAEQDEREKSDDVDAVDAQADTPVELPPDKKPVPVRSQASDLFSENKKDTLKLLIAGANRATQSNNQKKYILGFGLITILFASMLTYVFLFKGNYEEPADVRILAQISADEKPGAGAIDKNAVAEAVELRTEEKSLAHSSEPVVKKASIKKKKLKKETNKINVVRKSAVDPIDGLLNDAYAEFNLGRYEESKRLYTKVIDLEPRNRDALLGQAAIAIKQNNYDHAAFRYATLLRLDPKDSYARAGLSSIESKLDPQKNESRLKMMLSEQPEAAHLYFVLGSIYAGQKRWAEAQGEFFSAWSRESNNSDYAFNLAVSLDHLGKKKQALKFYQVCLESGEGNYSIAQLKDRIKTLKDNAHE